MSWPYLLLKKIAGFSRVPKYRGISFTEWLKRNKKKPEGEEGMDLSVHTATLSHQCSKSEFFRVRLFCLYWNLKPIWICGSFELRFLKQDVVSNIVWNGLSKPAFILVCNFAIFREITFLVLLLKGACLPSRNMHNIPKEVGRHLPPSTVLGRLCCLTFYLCLTIKSATP